MSSFIFKTGSRETGILLFKFKARKIYGKHMSGKERILKLKRTYCRRNLSDGGQ